MKIFITYLFITLFTLALFNCKKYPEGGYQKRGPKLILGNWKLSLYEVDGIDSTELINYNGTEDYKLVKIYKSVSVFEIEQKGSIEYSAGFTDNNKSITLNGKNDSVGSECTLYAGINYCFRRFFRPEGLGATEWRIIKLTKTEFVIEHSGAKNYKIKLSR
jgi:hypothetical protein